MFGFSMVQMVRNNASKLDPHLRKEILNLYRPFMKTPCIFHNLFEKTLQRVKKIPVIIEFENKHFEQGCQEVTKIMDQNFRNKLKHKFNSIPCCSAEVTPNGLNELLSTCHHIKKVYYNRQVNALLDVAVESANAKNVPNFTASTTLDGSGVTIAVIDTGIQPHTDLEGRIVRFIDLVGGRTDPYDDNGHGTHCAGDAAGNGTASGGKYAGPAPAANIVGVKVLNKLGSGSLDTVMRGVEACIQHNNQEDQEYPIDIISMSLGAPAVEDDPMVKVVEKAWASGIAVFVAAGNDGPSTKTISSPAVSNQVITVGALDDRNTLARGDDDVASFSSRGPTPHTNLPKPDILAPGVDIVSLRAPNSYIDKLQKTARVGNDYFVMSGTSMATPIAAGIGALLKQAYPDASPDELKKMIRDGADMWRNRDVNIYGAGYINAGNSIQKYNQ